MARKAKKKKSGIRIFAIFLLTVIIAALFYIALGNHQILEKENDVTPDSSDDRTAPVSSLKIELDPSVAVSSDQLNSTNAILIRLKDRTILMQKNSEEKIYPASLTKMMTAIVAIENLPDLEKEITLTNSTFQGLYEADASMAGFQPGEQVRAIDLLYGVMLRSGAECCIALADQIAGSEQNFVKIMNQRAAGLDMDDTHFENSTGLHSENHYTTVKDLAVLLCYALQNDIFREVFTSSHHFTRPTNVHPDGITFYSTMFEDLNNQNITGGEILGGKTGYTNEAGLCLASLAKVGKQEYILISAGAKGDHYTEQYNITDALAVYNSIGK
ncbi:D-alanyl-D-alanine carboxypeptidase DacF precursor [Sporotomaculum syntrophicum]|uniref:D-alanyl-D-alanine carboxypeptidase DacF n=1 Tax=Sporotomaculum syntrophicum TaxID=182264 RepID=A0A9D2WR25_9FIRM|nr:D-alanyl-D-alanine carboxypeptidase [Sporotomaculum syntrophicum]KAF1085042.1 D-alanyl-D-alanine carboxypeptidase DacF precursor [Sporotomaculum syntrophicum]